MRRIVRITAFFCLSVAIASTAVAGDGASKLTGELPRVLAEAGPDELIPVSIVLTDQLTGERLTSRATGITDPDERRRILISALKAHAGRTQKPLIAVLDASKLSGKADRLQPLWIGNIVAVEATSELILQIAERPEVGRINWAPKVDVFLERGPAKDFDLDFSPLDPEDDPSPDAVECGTDLMQAPRVWDELGNTGEGAVVAVIDSGVCWSHPDIVNQIWVNPGEDLDGDGVVMDSDDMNGVDDDGNGYVDDLIGYDIDNGDNDPNDNNSHGSHCAGTVAGDGTSGTQAGMAPDAQVMVLRVGLTFSDEPDVWEAMQYAADNGADSISMSLGWPHNQNPDRATWRQNCDNTIDLGTAMVIAAGNEGSGSEPDNVRTPGDVPRIISVGATDCSDNIASFSSRGPVSWENVDPFFDHPYPPGLIKPDVSAPGVSTQSHNLCSGYSSKSGTSMATPHVAGAVALMKSANPGLLHDDIKQILEDTSIDFGDPGKDNVFGSGRVDAYEAVLASQTSDGAMNIREGEVRCAGGTFNLVVSDQDLKSTGTLVVEIDSTTETAPESVMLTETSASSGVFKGTIQTALGPPASDGILQVSDGDLVTATYIDADDGEGGLNVPKTDTAGVDCSIPTISVIRATDQTTSSAIIRWETDEPADSRVTYGELKPPTLVESSAVRVTDHAVTLTGLTECTIYWYEVASTDEYGNEAVADNAGSYFFFETWGDFGNGPQPCHAGDINLDQSVLACDATLGVELVDIDLNLSATDVDVVTVFLTSSAETAPESLVLTETAPNSSTFTGSIATGGGPVVGGDGVVQTVDGATITATYRDEDNGIGQAVESYATAVSDCAGTDIVSITVVGITDESAQIQVETSEPTTITVDYGASAALGSQGTSNTLSTTHNVPIERFAECSRFYFTVSTVDTYGNPASFDANGVPFEANAGEIPGAIFKDGFETNTGWTLDGEWEIGAPQGLGTSPGDPTSAYAGGTVLGDDLSGQGSFPGDYEAGNFNEATYATSPVIDASSLTDGELKFRRWLNTGGGAVATVEVSDGGGWAPIWNSDSVVGESDSDWGLFTFDVSAYADGNGSFRVRFKQTVGFQAAAARAGWNLDRVIVRDGSEPPFAACDGCGGAPSFAGANSAVDNDACGAGGVTISWNEASSWGTGSGGTYAVYRDTAAGFTPSPGNLVGSGIAGLSFNDATAPDDAQWHYLVLAESDETCSTGPNNGGSLDANGAYVPVTTSSTQPVPADVVPILFDKVNHAHVRISWAAEAGATAYRIYRSSFPDSGFAVIDETTALFWEDLNQAGDANDWYYEVRPINACGQEP